MKELNSKKVNLITPEVINECLCESFGDIEKSAQAHKKARKQLN